MLFIASCECKNPYEIHATNHISLELCLIDFSASNIVSTLDTFISEEYCLIKRDGKLLVKTSYNANRVYNDTPCRHISLQTVSKEAREFNNRFLMDSYGGNASIKDSEININGRDFYIFHIDRDSTSLILLSTCMGDAKLEIELWEPLNKMKVVNSIRIKQDFKPDISE